MNEQAKIIKAAGIRNSRTYELNISGGNFACRLCEQITYNKQGLPLSGEWISWDGSHLSENNTYRKGLLYRVKRVSVWDGKKRTYQEYYNARGLVYKTVNFYRGKIFQRSITRYDRYGHKLEYKSFNADGSVFQHIWSETKGNRCIRHNKTGTSELVSTTTKKGGEIITNDLHSNNDTVKISEKTVKVGKNKTIKIRTHVSPKEKFKLKMVEERNITAPYGYLDKYNVYNMSTGKKTISSISKYYKNHLPFESINYDIPKDYTTIRAVFYEHFKNIVIARSLPIGKSYDAVTSKLISTEQK